MNLLDFVDVSFYKDKKDCVAFEVCGDVHEKNVATRNVLSMLV